MYRETIRKDLCKAYYDNEELEDLAQDVLYRKEYNYKHLLRAYNIDVAQLESILIEMGYMGV